MLIYFYCLRPSGFFLQSWQSVCFLGLWPFYPLCHHCWLLWIPLIFWYAYLFSIVCWLLPNPMMVGLKLTVLAKFTKDYVDAFSEKICKFFQSILFFCCTEYFLWEFLISEICVRVQMSQSSKNMLNPKRGTCISLVIHSQN